MFDGEVFGAEIVEAVRGYVERATAPLIERIAVLEAREAIAAQPGVKGDPGEPGIGVADAMINREGHLLLTMGDGRLLDLGHVVANDADIAPLVARIAVLETELADRPRASEVLATADRKQIIGEARKAATDQAVAAALKALPERQEAAAIDPEAIREIVREIHEEGRLSDAELLAKLHADVERMDAQFASAQAALLGPQTEAVQVMTFDMTKAVITDELRAAMDAIALAAHGKSVTAKDVAPLIEAEVAKAVSLIPAPKDGLDGVGLAGAIIDRAGSLTVTMTDGSTRDLGPVVGKDGEPGKPGKDAEPGRDGIHGLGFDDLTVEFDGERTATLVFTKGEARKAFPLVFPALIDRGVYKAGETYQTGDAVTWGGSSWIAQRETSAKPETTDDWRLSVKRGRDGKPGEPGKPGAPGKDGPPGPAGRNWS